MDGPAPGEDSATCEDAAGAGEAERGLTPSVAGFLASAGGRSFFAASAVSGSSSSGGGEESSLSGVDWREGGSWGASTGLGEAWGALAPEELVLAVVAVVSGGSGDESGEAEAVPSVGEAF